MPRLRTAGVSDAVEPAHGMAAGDDTQDASQRDGMGEADAASGSPPAKRVVTRFVADEVGWLKARFDANDGVLGRTVGYAAHKQATADLTGACAHRACEIACGTMPILSVCQSYCLFSWCLKLPS